MHRFLAFLATALFFLVTITPAQASQPEIFSVPKAGIVDAVKIDLRSGPADSESVFCRISRRGVSVKVLGEQGGWYYVQVASCVGWVKSNLITLQEAASSEQVEEAASPEPAEEVEVAASPEPVKAPEPVDEIEAGPAMYDAAKAGYVLQDAVDLLVGADRSAEALCRISKKGTRIQVLGEQGGWYYAKVANCVGWIASDQLGFEAPVMIAQVSPEPVKDPEPVEAAATPEPVEAAASPEPAEVVEEAASRESAVSPEPAEQVEEIKEEAEKAVKMPSGAMVEATLPSEDSSGQLVAQVQEESGELIYLLPADGRTGRNALDLRSGPTPGDSVVCRIPKAGTRVGVLTQQDNWFEVKIGACTGWALSKDLDLSGIEYERPVVVAEAAVETESADELPSLAEESIPEAEPEVVEEAPAEVAEAAAEEAAPAPVEPVAVEIKDIAFTGNTKIATEVLKAATAEFIGQQLTFDDMKVVAEAATIAYQEAGYILARAYLPPQAIQDGVLNIAISEGKLGKIEVTGNQYYNDRVLKRYFKPLIKEGVIRESLLEEAILLTKEIDSADASIVLKKGDAPGTVDMQVDTKDEFAVHWGADWNNTGTKLVSKQRFSTYFEITEPFWGSSLGVKGSTGSYWGESGLIDVNYTVPLFSWGTKLSLSYLEAEYVVGQDLAPLGIEGFTKVYTAEVRQPLRVSRNSRLDLVLGYDRKLTKNYILGFPLSIDEIDSYNVTLIYDSLDRYLGKNVINIGYSYSDMVDSRNDDKGLPTARVTEGHFERFTFLGARIQKLPGPFIFVGRAMAQATGDRLAPIEQMIIGGYSTVRGHKAGAYIGDYGYSLSGELMMSPPFIGNKELFGQRISQMFQLAAFYDFGEVYTKDPSAFEIDHESVAGFGMGFRVFYKDLVRLKFDVAWPQHKESGSEPYYLYVQAAVNFF